MVPALRFWLCGDAPNRMPSRILRHNDHPISLCGCQNLVGSLHIYGQDFFVVWIKPACHQRATAKIADCYWAFGDAQFVKNSLGKFSPSKEDAAAARHLRIKIARLAQCSENAVYRPNVPFDFNDPLAKGAGFAQ